MLYRFLSPALSEGKKRQLTTKIKESVSARVEIINTELCFNVALHRDRELSDAEKKKLEWVLGAPFDHQGCLSDESLLARGSNGTVIEIGPRLNFSTPFSTNAVSICHSVGLLAIQRIERSWRYLIVANSTEPGIDLQFSREERQKIVTMLHDRMTECEYVTRVIDVAPNYRTRSVETVDVMTNGRKSLEDVNISHGLAFDSWDLDYYTKLFCETIKRNPTTVECFDLAQSNSEHSRHWFFKGRIVIDGVEQEKSLMQMVMATQDHSAKNNVLAFCDNSSGIEGYDVNVLQPCKSSRPSKFECIDCSRHQVILTAETHNFPTAVSPFAGATTGTGGRIRDIQCAGQGSHVIAGTAGYSFGNLRIPGIDGHMLYNIKTSTLSFWFI
jgi:phosphoribosylformylglycinamidine synthase